MSRTYFDRAEPIVALATPEGRSALAVIRTSGENAVDIVARCFSQPQALLGAEGYHAVYGWIFDPVSQERLDEVVALVFRAPHSFTGENAVEIMCHGSTAVAQRILEVLYTQGFSPALPGEFSFRAFAGGKTDLVRAEAINELTHASCEAARHDALQRLSGVLSRKLEEIRNLMIDVLADINARLDYPEDEGPEETDRWVQLMQRAQDELSDLIRSYPGGRLRQEGLLVVIAGRPNAGKSSLFNLLVREERAIVSPEPGTTRDWLEAWISIGDFAVRIVDTAGLRNTGNSIEAEGVRRSHALLARADVILYLVDGTVGLDDEDRSFVARYPRALLLWNKADLSRCMPAPSAWAAVSAKDIHSFGSFESMLKSALHSSIQEARTSGQYEAQVRIASERQARLLWQAHEAIAQAMEAQTAGAGLDLVALHIRESAECIGEITGDIAPDEVLERVFSTFCLGK
jgi:tRNA modification GTPase